MNADPPDNVPPLLERLDALRETWAAQAHALEYIYGKDNAGSKALRMCIGDLFRATHPERIQEP